MNKLMEKIQKHPKSQVARAYRLGQAQAQSEGLLPLLKLSIRYLMLRNKGILRSKRDDNELKKVTEKLEALTKGV